MKILLVVHNFWPNFRAGTENATYFLAQELAKKNKVTVFTVEPNSDKADLIESYMESNFNVIKLHRTKSFPKNLKDTYFNKELEKIFKEKLEELSPDVVHFQHLLGLSLKFISIVKEKNIPVFYTLHDFWFECPRIRRNYKGENCYRSNNKQCNECIMNSFLFVNSDNDANWIMKKANMLMRVRFLKRLAHILLNKAGLKYLLNYGNKKVDLIGERKKDFIQYLSLVDEFISPSRFLKQEAVKFGLDPNKIGVISHGLSSVREKLVKKEFAKDGILRFCFLSHITKDKGFFLLLKSFEKLLEKNKNMRLYLYGSYDKNEGAIKKTLNKISKNKYIDYGGVFEAGNISNVLSDIDVVIIPSLWEEIYGLVLDEAFNFGIPVIVSNRGGLPERVKDGMNGFVFNPDVEDDLYEKMKIISEKPAILKNMADNIPNIKSIGDYAFEIENKYMQKYNGKKGN